MKVLALGALLVLAVGCGSATRQATPQDKANLDRLAKEGIGAPGDTGKAPPPGSTDGQLYAPKGGP